MKTAIETERKFIIKMPDFSELDKMNGYQKDEITQIYIPSNNGSTHRVRKRISCGKVVCTETEKVRIDKASSIEKEGEITLERFEELSANILDGTKAICKVRHTFEYLGQVFEIDVYPEWQKTAIMETELPSIDHTFQIPDPITVIREVTGLKEYSNASMSRNFPIEDSSYL